MKVLLAPDKFKGSLSASGVAASLRRGFMQVRETDVVLSMPIADGGDGTLDAAEAAGFERVPVTVSGPTGVPVTTAYARRGPVAVVEMADACGLDRLPRGVLAPLTASSRGLGEVIAAAAGAGCTEIVVGIGGSASTDGGAGMVAALGARLLDDGGNEIAHGGAALSRLASLDLSRLHPRIRSATVIVASDVNNPLLGPAGAAAVYGPQKGASTDDVAVLEAGLVRWSDLVCQAVAQDARSTPGAGAAGGVGFAAMALLGGGLHSGIDLLLDLLEFDEALSDVDLVVTGEGSLDEQSLRGKAPIGVAARAARRGVPAVAVAGRRTLSDATLQTAGIVAAYALTDLEADPAVCMSEPGRLLERLGAHIALTHGPRLAAREGAR